MAILILNCGSSSIKYTLYEEGNGQVIHHGLADRVTDYTHSLETIFEEFKSRLEGGLDSIRGIGHRVVHGGIRFTSSHIVDKDVLDTLKGISKLAPLHNPHNIRGIEFSAKKLPGVPQVAVFDTAFHSTMPQEAHLYALPHKIAEEYSIKRYGFHGISHHYVYDRVIETLGRKDPKGFSVIICHLGNGCSISAVKDGRCVDTSMGFTPLEGLVMGTRTGDLDPAVVLFLMSSDESRLTLEQTHNTLNRESGLLGISGLSHDIRDLLKARREGNERAALAIKIFTYRLKKYIAAYHGVLSGSDVLVFTAGIGENSPDVRAETLAGLEPLGFVLDEQANIEAKGVESVISAPESPVKILVVPTDEDRLIFEETAKLLS